jgi:divalent metal cation (Fe/Co/Zn/Cd) transporter
MDAVSLNNKRFQTALVLSYLSIGFAFIEAAFSTYFGVYDESLSLFGFGIGSLIEVVSAIGVAQMIMRIRQNPNSDRSQFEKTALRITGTGFYILVIGLSVTCVYNIYTHHKPETTISGVIISLVSISLMLVLVFGKLRIGKSLNSDAIIADAECTKVCIYTSIILLVSSVIFTLTHLPYVDELGTAGIVYFAFKEGKECFDKAKNNSHCCSHC